MTELTSEAIDALLAAPPPAGSDHAYTLHIRCPRVAEGGGAHLALNLYQPCERRQFNAIHAVVKACWCGAPTTWNLLGEPLRG